MSIVLFIMLSVAFSSYVTGTTSSFRSASSMPERRVAAHTSSSEEYASRTSHVTGDWEMVLTDADC